MRKQVTFAENLLVQPSLRGDHLSRCDGRKDSEIASNFTGGLRSPREATGVPPEAAVVVPRSVAAAPHLQHAALTPAQRDFLYTVAASYSAAHVRQLITRHYLNVLRRCTRRGSPERDTAGVTPSQSNEKPQPELLSGTKVLPGKKSARNSRKSSHPKIPRRTPKHGKPRKRRTAAGSGEAASGPAEEREEEADDSASDCLSSLSLTDWDDDDDSGL